MSVHIYKDNLRQSLFRTLVFTDTMVFVISGGAVAGITFLIFKMTFPVMNFYAYLIMVLLLETILVTIATYKRDNQPVYKLLSRGLFFLLTKQNFQGNELSDFYRDITIQDNLLLKKHRISKIFHIRPYDISALNINERNAFFAGLQQALHTLPQRLQVIVRKEIAKPDDFTDHLMHVYKSLPKGNKQKEKMVANYQRDFLDFVTHRNLLTVKQYGVFAVEADTDNVEQKVNAIGKLDDMYVRLASNLEGCNIKTKQLTNEELEEYMKGVV